METIPLPTGSILPAPQGGRLTEAGAFAIARAAIVCAGMTHHHLRRLTDRRAEDRGTDRRA